MKQKKIVIANEIPVYRYMGYIYDAIKAGQPFKYREVNQLGARLSGKTTSDNVELVRAIIAARDTKQKLFILILRMRYKSIGKAWNDIVNILKKFKIPYRTWVGKGVIKVWTTKIIVEGCYTTNSTEISFLGFDIQNSKYGILVFEEAKEFDEETVNAVLIAIRGIKHQTVIYRSNPYHLTNWFPQKCYKKVMFSENTLRNGSGNQFTELNKAVYHYMRYDVNPFNSEASIARLEWNRINNPIIAETEVYGLPGTTKGMVFASIIHKINRNFVRGNWKYFTAGVDVGHVSIATAAVFFALDSKNKKMYQLGEYWHSNETMRHKESNELASDIVAFFSKFQEELKFTSLEVNIDCADPGFISQVNSTAKQQGKYWLWAQASKKIRIEQRISIYTEVINNGALNISLDCVKSFEELGLIAYDEKAEDDKVKLIKQNDHTWDASIYALTPYFKDFTDY